MKIIYLFLFMLFAVTNTYASPLWEGKWEFGRYSNGLGGVMTIKNCQNNVCEFDIITNNGAHVCTLDGELTFKDNKAQYTKNLEHFFEYEENDVIAIVDFELDEQMNLINVSSNFDAHRMYCGMQGYFDGVYENESNPLRYKTSFDCWQNNLSDVEKTICANQKLALADIEMSEKYKSSKDDDWYKQRENCKTDVECLWIFYVESIKNGYTKISNGTLNLYQYMGKLSENDLYYPTDFVLLDDYFRKNMSNNYYKIWKMTFDKIYIGSDKCDDCYYYQYGVTGFFTIYESAFYIDENEIWISFISANLEEPEDKYIIVYAPKGKTIKNIPKQFDAWIKRLEPYYSEGIKLKNFKS